MSPQPRGLGIGAADSSYAAFTAATGVRPSVMEHYASTGTPFSVRFAGPAEPLIQLEPKGVSLTAVTAGEADWWLRPYARDVAGYGKPVILGFAPEMNGVWYAWGWKQASPAAYVAAWRHVTAVFRAAGARNVTWLWTVNVSAGGTGKAAAAADPSPWWPGTGEVQEIGIDGYFYSAGQTFASRFTPMITAVRGIATVPVMVSEAAAAPGPARPAQVTDLFTGARGAGLAALVWFDLPGNRDWRIDGDPAALAAFQAAARKYG
jgi:hypothetical protein